MVISDIISSVMAILMGVVVIAAVIYPLSKVMDIFQNKRLIKKIPEKVIKEVKDARERKDKKRKQFQEYYANAERELERRENENPTSGERKKHLIGSDPIKPDEGSTIERNRIQVPTPGTARKNRKRIELHKPATLRLE